MSRRWLGVVGSSLYMQMQCPVEPTRVEPTDFLPIIVKYEITLDVMWTKTTINGA